MKLRDGMRMLYQAPSGNSAFITVEGRGEKGALLVKWKRPHSAEDSAACESHIVGLTGVSVDVSATFKSAEDARAAHDAYLKESS
jgi:hypothetical protein